MTYPTFNGFEWGDMEDYMMPWMLPQSGNAGSRSDTGTSRGRFNPMAPIAPYMNNPFGLNMQKCMDNDMCTSWAQRRMYFGGQPSQQQGGGYGGQPTQQQGGSGSTDFAPPSDAGSGSTDSGSVDSGSSSDAGEATASSSASNGASSDSSASSDSNVNNGGSTRYSFTPPGRNAQHPPSRNAQRPDPSMFGFPPGFNPMNYGLDWDSRPQDCMDDSRCARGLMMFSGGRPISQQPAGSNGMMSVNIDPRIMAFASEMFGYPSRLQRTRRLRNPRAHYGAPAYYGY